MPGMIGRDGEEDNVTESESVRYGIVRSKLEILVWWTRSERLT